MILSLNPCNLAKFQALGTIAAPAFTTQTYRRRLYLIHSEKKYIYSFFMAIMTHFVASAKKFFSDIWPEGPRVLNSEMTAYFLHGIIVYITAIKCSFLISGLKGTGC